MLGSVLAHQVDIGRFGERFGNEFQKLLGPGGSSGQDQMPEHEAATGHSESIEFEKPDLPVHLLEGGLDIIRVAVSLVRVFCRFFGIHIFGVGKINIDKAVEQHLASRGEEKLSTTEVGDRIVASL